MNELEQAQKLMASDLNTNTIAKMSGISRQTIYTYRYKGRDLSQAKYENVVKLAKVYQIYQANNE